MKQEHQADGGAPPERGRDVPVAPILILVGGFLGAGKTTTILQAARHLRSRDQRVAIITNDQAASLVDTEVARTVSDHVFEIPDGCFCCQYDQLDDVLAELTAVGPDVILAEAVGSCTDLVATVCQPLRQLSTGTVTLGPLSVVADGLRLRESVFGLAAMEPDIAYLHERQLAEADIILLNKIDLLTDEERTAVTENIVGRYPGATVLAVSASDGVGIDAWCNLQDSPGRFGERVLSLDYDRYAAAEASLGWVNLAGTVAFLGPDSSESWLRSVIELAGAFAGREGVEIAHLKVWLESERGSVRGNLVGRNRGPTVTVTGRDGAANGRLLVNARAAASPDRIREWIETAIARASTEASASVDLTEGTAFRPARPVPIHRLLPLVPVSQAPQDEETA